MFSCGESLTIKHNTQHYLVKYSMECKSYTADGALIAAGGVCCHWREYIHDLTVTFLSLLQSPPLVREINRVDMKMLCCKPDPWHYISNLTLILLRCVWPLAFSLFVCLCAFEEIMTDDSVWYYSGYGKRMWLREMKRKYYWNLLWCLVNERMVVFCMCLAMCCVL